MNQQKKCRAFNEDEDVFVAKQPKTKKIRLASPVFFAKPWLTVNTFLQRETTTKSWYD